MGTFASSLIVLGLIAPLVAGCGGPPPPAKRVPRPLDAIQMHGASVAQARYRTCQITIAARTTSTSDLVIVEDPSGDTVELRVTSGEATLTVMRSFDGAHRLLTERRRGQAPQGEWTISLAWDRDERGRVKRAERTLEDHPASGAASTRTLVATVTEWHAGGRWLKREVREGANLVRTESRVFDADGRVTAQRTESASNSPEVATLRFSYAGSSVRPRTETSEVSVGRETAKIVRETEFDDNGRVVRLQVKVRGDEEEGNWERIYDAEGRLTARARSDGRRDTYSYSGDCPIDPTKLIAEPSAADD